MKICSRCLAVFDGNKWIYNPKLYLELIEKGIVAKGRCPGCERVLGKQIEGTVRLEGSYLKTHKRRAIELIKDVAEKRKREDVAARIFSIIEDEEGLTLEVTDETLAKRIGEQFKQVFSGDLNINRPKEAGFVKVYWRRDKSS